MGIHDYQLYDMAIMERKWVGAYEYIRVPSGWIMLYTWSRVDAISSRSEVLTTPIFIPWVAKEDINLGSTI